MVRKKAASKARWRVESTAGEKAARMVSRMVASKALWKVELWAGQKVG